MRRVIPWAALLSMSIASPGFAKESHRAKLPIEQARAVALQQVAGTVVHEEMEKEKGRWIYSFEIRPTGEGGRRVKEVNLDADTGAVVEIATEND